MSSKLFADPKKAIEYVNWLSQDAPLYLEQMSSQGNANPKHKLYPANESASAVRFVAGNNNDTYQRNMYFVPNAEFLIGKRNKDNLSAVRFLHVDLDCKDYPGDLKQQEERILALLFDEPIRPKGIPQPSAIWFTGGGFQAVWKLNEPISVELAEELNHALLVAFQGGLGTHDASRLLRLPWTMNWLNDKKRADGRVPKLARPLHPFNLNSPPESFSVGDFQMRRTKSESKFPVAATGTPNQSLEFDPLPLPDDLNSIIPLDQKWAEVILTGENPPDKNYSSRSELVFAATLWMLGKGMEPGHVLSILIDPEIGISAHVLDNPNPTKYGRRQIQRAHALLEMKQNGWPITNDEGNPVPRIPENIRYAFSLLGVDAQRNLFTQTNEVTGYQLDERDLNEIGDILWSAFSRKLKFSASPEVIKRELVAVAHENTYHPVIDYLDGLEWDGVPRIDQWLATYTSAADNELNREFGSKFLVAAVRRIKQPGVKFDTMLVLEGSQGAGKSRLAATLAKRDEWFCGSLDLKSDDKAKAELLSRAWIVECQELDGLNKTTSQNLKKFLSTSIDLFRPAYGRTVLSYKRHCVILGTTNEGTYLRDLTGNRRMWPVTVGKIDLKRVSTDVDQIWAEAVVREREGGSIVLSKHLWDEARKVQGYRMVEDDFAEVMQDNFAERTGKVSMDSIKLLLNLDASRMSPSNARRIKAAMGDLGWVYGTYRMRDLAGSEPRPRKGFARGADLERKEEIFAVRKHGGTVVLDTKFAPPDTPF
ncbi:VapE domain-containing protein [Actibacterium pelagium]|uniref:Virulence-associated protein E-like domain-containing protein n=1 Tax=Actibacterium pelagium TaxID=2029103 RepID=A0A917AIL6_9RHOB|nr:VapE domain-containing protein [Actibacterium pelagium]GGE55799.1 hypothetical protein GCM10011517_24300 [Actibacterium pelagium]